MTKIPMFTGNIGAGKVMEGAVLYEIPADWQEFELNYNENYNQNKLTFTVTPDMVI